MSKAQDLKKLREESGRKIVPHDFLVFDETATIESYYENIITAEEIDKAAEKYRDRMDLVLKDFEKKTKLNKVDMGFLLTATALQCVRQYFLTPFRERVDDQTAAKNTAGKLKEHSDRSHRYYSPSLEEVISNPVPFDANQGSPGALVGGGNFGHRGVTPGHDPILGYIFGTANIATSTLTNWKMQSYHIRTFGNRDTFAENASTLKVFENVWKKLKSNDPLYGRTVVAASLIKEHIHLKSDIGSKDSLPTPIVGTLNPKLASDLADYGVDAANIMDFLKQASLAITINTLISMLHGLYGTFWEKNTTEEEVNLHKVRTRKILLYSNLLASSSNVIATAISQQWEYFDLGGLIVTLYRLYSDPEFIYKMKLEYLNNTVSKIYEDRFKEVEWMYS